MVSSESRDANARRRRLAISRRARQTRGGGDVVDVGRVERVVSIVVDETRERGVVTAVRGLETGSARARDDAAGDAQGGALGRAATRTRRRERERWW